LDYKDKTKLLRERDISKGFTAIKEIFPRREILKCKEMKEISGKGTIAES